MENFLPEGYEKIPSNGRYMKLLDGENTFRVLSPAVTGWLYWNTSNKPVRSKQRWDEIPHDIRIESNGLQSKVKHFWAFVVWNYDESAIQILEVTQVQIMNAVKALVDSKHWGNPKNYDISVSRSGTGFDTEYVVQGIPPAPLNPKITAEYAKQKINLDAYVSGEDPFAGGAKPGAKKAEPDPKETQAAAATPARYASVPEAFRPKVEPDDEIPLPEMPA